MRERESRTGFVTGYRVRAVCWPQATRPGPADRMRWCCTKAASRIPIGTREVSAFFLRTSFIIKQWRLKYLGVIQDNGAGFRPRALPPARPLARPRALLPRSPAPLLCPGSLPLSASLDLPRRPDGGGRGGGLQAGVAQALPARPRHGRV